MTFERLDDATDDLGQSTLTWTQLGQALANVLYGNGQERRQAAQETATVPATFRVLSNAITANVVPKDRITFDGASWDILSSVAIGRFEREITAVRVA